MRLVRLTAALALAAPLSGCEGDSAVSRSGGGKADDLGTFEEFVSGLYCEPDDGPCIVQGDVPIFSEAELRELWERGGGGGQALTVMHSDSADAIWDRTVRFDLSYCVSDDFGERKNEIAAAMSDAAREWEAIAHVKFRHAEDQDERCHERNAQVLFDVSPAPESSWYFARAFFPDNEEREDRRVLINTSEIDSSMDDEQFEGKLNLRGILRHELGHVLGFRHEHIRPENSGNFFCMENEDFRPLTEYDARSVMHYPQCDGEGDWGLEFTDIDAQGARFFYPDYTRFRGGRCTVEVKGSGEVNADCDPIVHEILDLANTASFELLDDYVGLDRRAVESLVDGRSTQPVQSLADLEELPYIGPDSVRRFYDYLYVDGRCPVELDNEGRVDVLCRPVVHRVLDLANNASLEELDDAVSLDRRAAENILERRAEAPLTDLAELWDIGYVKDRALAKMYSYLYE